MAIGLKDKARAKRGIKQRRAELYRSAVLEAAERVFAERGFEAAKMQEVAAASGVALATLYSVFPGKSELYAAIHERRGSELLARAAEAPPAGGDAVALLLEGVSRYVGYFVDHPDFLRMHLREGAAWAMPGRTMRTDEQRLAWSEGVRRMAEVVAAGISDGLFVAEDPERVAKMMIAMQQVQLADWIEHDGGADPSPLIDRVCELLVRAFCTPAGADRARGILQSRGEGQWAQAD